MNSSRIPNNHKQERIGVHLTAYFLLTKLGIVFRETSNTDIGIDGIIEYDLENQAVGTLAAVQIKSGKSYFLKDKGDHFAFYPKKKHKVYWGNFPLPVMLILHNPETNNIYFSDVSYYLSIPERVINYPYIPVFKDDEISKVTKEELFGLPKISNLSLLPIDEILKNLISTSTNNSLFPISYFDIFVNGLTNQGRHSSFSVSLLVQIAYANMFMLNSFKKSELPLKLGSNEYLFFHNYVKYMYSQRLIKIDYTEYMIDCGEYSNFPEFMATLTQRGHELVSLIYQIEENIVGKDNLKIPCDCPIQQVFTTSGHARMVNVFRFSIAFINK